MIDITRRPEDQLLIEFVTGSVGQSDIATARRLLASDVDWTYLIRTAPRHQVLPLLQGLLTDCERVGATVRLGARFPVLPFKGAVLAAEFYGDVSLRQFADVDLLIDAKHSGTAEEFLRSLGYACREDHGSVRTCRGRCH